MLWILYVRCLLTVLVALVLFNMCYSIFENLHQPQSPGVSNFVERHIFDSSFYQKCWTCWWYFSTHGRV